MQKLHAKNTNIYVVYCEYISEKQCRFTLFSKNEIQSKKKIKEMRKKKKIPLKILQAVYVLKVL